MATSVVAHPSHAQYTPIRPNSSGEGAKVLQVIHQHFRAQGRLNDDSTKEATKRGTNLRQRSMATGLSPIQRTKIAHRIATQRGQGVRGKSNAMFLRAVGYRGKLAKHLQERTNFGARQNMKRKAAGMATRNYSEIVKKAWIKRKQKMAIRGVRAQHGAYVGGGLHAMK